MEVNKDTNADINDFLNEQVQRLRILRATAIIDYYYGIIKGEINIETPTRAKKQLKRIIEALMSLDDNYDIYRAKIIVERFVESSGNQLRLGLMEEFEKDPYRAYRIFELANKLRADKKSIKLELSFLWKLGWMEKIEKDEDVYGKIKPVLYYMKN